MLLKITIEVPKITRLKSLIKKKHVSLPCSKNFLVIKTIIVMTLK